MSRGLPTPGYNLVPTFGPKPGTLYSEDFVVVAWESGSCKVAGREPFGRSGSADSHAVATVSCGKRPNKERHHPFGSEA